MRKISQEDRTGKRGRDMGIENWRKGESKAVGERPRPTGPVTVSSPR